jgi:hypothetical protein
MVLTGTGFLAGSIVRWDGADRPTTYVSRNRLEATVLAADLEEAGSANITVYNPGPGGGTSTPVTLTISNVAPSITAINPVETEVGTQEVELTIDGGGFSGGTYGSVVQWAGTDLPTTVVNSTTLTATVSASDLDNAGVFTITVRNPAPGASTSNEATFSVRNALPSISGLSPSGRSVGSGAFTLTVTGSGFSAGSNGSIVRWNGVDRTTTCVSSTQIVADILADDVASAGVVTVTVYNPAPGGGESNGVTLTVSNEAPAITSISPDTVIADSSAFSLTVRGSGFSDGSLGSTVYWNGAERHTVYINSGRLLAAIGADDVTDGGYFTVTVVNPAPGGGSSNVVTFTVTNPVPSISSLNPTTATVGGGQFSLTVNGSNFLDGANASMVQWNGAGRTTSYVSSTRLHATILASDISSAGTYTVAVSNPIPGGGVSNPLTFTVEDVPIAGLIIDHSTPTRAGEPITFTTSLTQGTGVSYAYNFDDDTTEQTLASSIVHTYTLTGTYTTIVTATNSVSQGVVSTTFTVDAP